MTDSRVRVFVVWVPILPSDQGLPDSGTLALIPDRRYDDFWDADGTLPEQFAEVLRLPHDVPAWDVYLLYRPGAKWGNEPPAPAYWQHQLGRRAKAPRLDGKSFAQKLGQVLGDRV